jgi:hypothetical protein
MGTSAVTQSVIPFLTWTIEKAKKAAAIAADALEALKVNRKFVEGDHWQDGAGWVGPWPVVPEAASAAELDGVSTLQAEIKKMFTARNAIGEVTERHVAGIMGREPRWTFVLRDPIAAIATDGELSVEQDRDRTELEARLTQWWDDAGAHTVLQELARKLLYGQAAALRIYVPAGLLTPNGDGRAQLVVKRGDLADALSKIRVESPEPEECRVVTDVASGRDVGILLTKDEKERDSVELTFLDEQGKTVLLVIKAGPDAGTVDRRSVQFDLGGRLLMFETGRTEFLTEQARQSQRALNYCNTVVIRNVTTGGFLEQVLLNAKLPGHWEEREGGGRVYVPDPIYRGPGTLNSFSGHEYEDGQGNKQITTPTVVWREPISPEPSIKAKQEYYADVLDEADQRHILISGEATVSGYSREQARADYANSLNLTRAPLTRAGRWMLEAVLAYAEALAGTPGQYSRTWRASFECIVDTGPLSPEERAAIREDAKSRLIAYGTARELTGVADPDAERERIETEDGIDQDAELKRAQIFKAWVDAGIGFEAAARRAGLSDDETRDLLEEAEQPPTPEPGTDPAAPPIPPGRNAGGNAANAGNAERGENAGAGA